MKIIKLFTEKELFLLIDLVEKEFIFKTNDDSWPEEEIKLIMKLEQNLKDNEE